MSDHICHYCNRSFSRKTILSYHSPLCKQIHTIKREKVNEFDAYEPLMSDKQRDNMIRHLFFQVTKMNDKMQHMQKEITSLKNRQRMNILSLLNSAESKPVKTFQQWIKSLVITQRHLEVVFQTSLRDGIMRVMQDNLETAKNLRTFLPVKAYTQKAGTLYVYATQDDDSAKWVMLDTHLFRKSTGSLGARFFELFLQWQTDNAEYLQSSDAAQDQDMCFTQKIMDESYKMGTSLVKMMEGLHTTIHTSFQTMDFS